MEIPLDTALSAQSKQMYAVPLDLQKARQMPKFKFSEDDMTPVDHVEAMKTRIAWHLTFEKQSTANFVSMTNGMDPAMRVGIFIEINTPAQSRAAQLLHVFKSRDGSHDPDNPLKKVTLTIHVPSEHDTVFNDSYLQDTHYGGKVVTFDNTVGSLTDIVIRSSLETVVHDYFFRETLQSAAQSVISYKNTTRKERISLYSIFYASHVNVQEKMEFITKAFGVWIRVGRWSHTLCSSRSKASKLIDPNEFVIVAVLPATLERTLRMDRHVVRLYIQNKLKGNDEQPWIRLA